MAEQKKGWGATVAGWFVEFEGDEEAPAAASKGKGAPPKAAPAPAVDSATDDIIRRYAGGGKAGARPAAAKPAAVTPDLAPARSPSGEAPPDFGGGAAAPQSTATSAASGDVPEAGPDGAIDFQGVFKKAGITAEEADRVSRALALLSQLPAETPQAVKKQIVEAALNSFGVPIESIIESAVAEIEALHACIQSGQSATESLLAQSQARIEQLRQQMDDVQQVILARQSEQRTLEQQARAHGLKVQQILEFFGQELVGKVVKDSARLHEPEEK